jgi:hypothetical protein
VSPSSSRGIGASAVAVGCGGASRLGMAGDTVAVDRHRVPVRRGAVGGGWDVPDGSRPSNRRTPGTTSTAAAHATIETSRVARAILVPNDELSIGA